MQKYAGAGNTGPMISVIVPFFNEERCLSACVESVLAQDFSDLELLLVDDKSTDGSGWIAEEYAKKDDRIHALENTGKSGVAAARNCGLERACGRYITFADADDKMTPDCLSSLYGAQKETGADWISCAFFDITEATGSRKRQDLFPASRLFGAPEIRTVLADVIFDNPGRLSMARIFPNLYDAEIVQSNRVRFCENLPLYEDAAFNYVYLQYSHSFYYLNETHYDRLLHDSSAIHRFRENILSEIGDMFQTFCNLFSEFGQAPGPAFYHFVVSRTFDAFLMERRPENPVPGRRWRQNMRAFLGKEPMRSLWKSIRLRSGRNFTERMKIFCFKTGQIRLLEWFYRLYEIQKLWRR